MDSATATVAVCASGFAASREQREPGHRDRSERLESVVFVLAREGNALARECLDPTGDSEIKLILETMFLGAAVRAAIGPAIGRGRGRGGGRAGGCGRRTRRHARPARDSLLRRGRSGPSAGVLKLAGLPQRGKVPALRSRRQPLEDDRTREHDAASPSG
jgi:hypothetical protein